MTETRCNRQTAVDVIVYSILHEKLECSASQLVEELLNLCSSTVCILSTLISDLALQLDCIPVGYLDQLASGLHIC